MKTQDFDVLNKQLMKLLKAQDPKALKIIDKLKNIGIRKKDNSLIGYAYYRYAYFYYFSNQDLSKFRKNVQLAIKHLIRSDNKEFLGGSYNLVAYDALDQGCYDVAYAYYMLAVKTLENEHNISLPGLIEASAGRLLIELGDYKKGQTQQKSAIMKMRKFTNMHVYDYNMILTYADIALASFLLKDIKGVNSALNNIENHYDKASKEEKNLSKTYYHLAYIYKALLTDDEELLEHKLNSLLRFWKKLQDGELIGLMFEIESLCKYMLKYDYINQCAKVLQATSRISKDSNLSVVSRYYTLQILYYEKIHDLINIRKYLHKQHDIKKKQSLKTINTIKYTMEFSDMISLIAKEREKVKEENIILQIQANTDALTGLPNRNAMNNYLQNKFSEAEELQTKIGIGIVDVDNFKQYNDTYGHQAGDTCLKNIGKVLLKYNKLDNVFCARYGGDEFVIGYFNLNDDEIIKLKNEMEDKVLILSRKNAKEQVHISQGFYNEIPDGKKKLWDYLTIADKELYRMKKKK